MSKRIIISSLLPDAIVSELESMRIQCIFGGKSSNIKNETAYHPDMLFFKLLDGTVLTEKGFIHNLETFCAVKQSRVQLESNYPKDCAFNCLYSGNFLICGKSAAPEIIEDAKKNSITFLVVKQGYVACSTVRLNNEAYICADTGISYALRSAGFDVLTVSNSGILLNGYSNGFIGGCALYIDKSVVAFSGKIEEHREYDMIKSFCANYGVVPYSLSNNTLYDYGGGIRLD